MGQTTPNMSIYIPAAGETNYESSFSSGMVNVDQHDHTGAPTKGVQIATTGLTDGSVTYPKLNANVADTATGIGVDGANPNKLQILGLLKQIYALAPLADGQLIIGSTGLSPAKAVPTAGPGIAITVGAGSLTIASASSVVIQKFVYTGAPQTYTPTANMRYCIIEVCGGGGGGGGYTATGVATVRAGGGGGGGGYAKGVFSAATIGASQVVLIAAGGTGSSTVNVAGGTGGSVSVGALISATGGAGGTAGVAHPFMSGGAGGGGIGGDFQTTGNAGTSGLINSAVFAYGGSGGSTYFGGSSVNFSFLTAGNQLAGENATSYGAGGSGAAEFVSDSTDAGGNGMAGIVIITEFM